ncbi:MAG: glycosyltransferase family 2 protein, partial [Kiritimatiellae bacterium]|nr:glycosyltransferase family 2 protein [Kiritimatiellia bacterium]
MSETPSISVVIPTFNRAKMVCDCVASLLETGWPALEIIVVDDCSPDDTAKRLAARFPNDSRVRYLRNERNAFQAYSRNRGAAV